MANITIDESLSKYDDMRAQEKAALSAAKKVAEQLNIIVHHIEFATQFSAIYAGHPYMAKHLDLAQRGLDNLTEV